MRLPIEQSVRAAKCSAAHGTQEFAGCRDFPGGVCLSHENSTISVQGPLLHEGPTLKKDHVCASVRRAVTTSGTLRLSTRAPMTGIIKCMGFGRWAFERIFRQSGQSAAFAFGGAAV